MKKIQILYLLFSFVQFHSGFAQQEKNNQQLKWEFSLSSGLFFETFYADLIIGGYNSTPPGYSDKKGKRVNIGKLDRLEMSYYFNKKSSMSFYFQHAHWRELLGSILDPLGVWKELKDESKRFHFTLAYNKIFKSGAKNSWVVGSGFQVQIEKKSFPFYRVDDPANPTVVTEISARPDWTYFEDWAIPLTITHYWHINQNLKLGATINTAYTMGTGIDGIALLGNIAIPFGREITLNKRKTRK